MQETFNLLMKNDSRIMEYYQNVKKLWEEVLKKKEALHEDSLAKILQLEQFKFEAECDNDRSIGKELMAIVGILQYYDYQSGFDRNIDKVKLLYSAIEKSSYSLEVKYSSEEIAKHFHLIESS